MVNLSKMRVVIMLFITVMTSAFLCFRTNAQVLISNHALELLGGYTGDGYSVGVGYVNYFTERFAMRTDPFFSKESKYGLEHTVMGLDVYLPYTIKYISSLGLYLNLIPGFTVSREYGNFRGQEQMYTSFKMGFSAGVGIEKYLGLSWSLIANFNQRYMLNPRDQWGSLRWVAEIGLRYHILNRKVDED